MRIIFLKSIFLFLFFSLSVGVHSHPHTSFKYRIAIIGNPINPDTSYTDGKLKTLKEGGFNTIQLNIAWGTRPANEALNLEDILYVQGIGEKDLVGKRLSLIKFRARMAKRWGFRTVFHFGAPRIYQLYKTGPRIDEATEENSIQKQEVIDRYVSLLRRLKQEIPELDDILLYTFDQDAWIANEFGNGRTDMGIPLHERVPNFLKILTKTWGELNSDGMLWWEPWELSAGQIYACFPQLPTSNFGFSLHSNIAEVQMTRPTDVWFRNMVLLAKEKNIPVVGEIFMCSNNEELDPLKNIAVPRLVGEEIDAMYNLLYVAGIKEYYGLIPDQYDPNQLMASLKLNDLKLTNKQALQKLSKPYGKYAKDILNAWEATATGMALFPWDATWNFRRLPVRPIQAFHVWNAAKINGQVAGSPSWYSTRRSLFMTTVNEIQHPWFFEDIELRCFSAAKKLTEAIEVFQKLKVKIDKDPYAGYIAASLKDLQLLEQVVVAIRCYCRESNLAWLMRKQIEENQAIPDNLIKRFEEIMQIDIQNQQKGYVQNIKKYETAEEMLDLFRKDPAKWVKSYLLFN